MLKLNWHNKLIFFAVVVAIIPITISSLTMINSTKDELKSSTNYELMMTAGQLAQEINTYYTNRWLGPLLLLRSGLESEELGAEEKAAILSAGIKSIEDIASLALIFEVEPNQYVTAIETQKEEFVHRLQERGVDVAANLTASFPEVIELRQRGSNLGSPRFIPAVDTWLMTSLLPVKIAGAPTAILVAQIELNRIRERVQSQTVSKNGRIMLIDAKGRELFDVSGKPLNDLKVVQDATEMLSTGSRAQGVTSYTTPAGKKMVGCYAFPQDINWAIIAEINEDEAYVAVSKMLNSLLWWVLLGMAIAVAGAFIFSQHVSKPILTMSKAAEEISSGQFDVQVDYRANDEIGVLGKSLVNMGKSLKENFDKIEKQNRELEEYSKGLEVKVNQRTAELKEKNIALEKTLIKLKETQDQLIVNEKLASLGALTAGIAHEIKNPLNFINNFAILSGDMVDELSEELDKENDRISQEVMDEVQDLLNNLKMNVTKISEHGKRADRIVHSMLQHSRGNVGEFQETDMVPFLEDCVAFACDSLRAKDPLFKLDLQRDLTPVTGKVNINPGSLSQVIVNIVNNSIYALKEKKKKLGDQFQPDLRVSLHDNGEKVEIRIRDNGPGIAKKHVEKIFEPFFTTKPTGEGTGLGLSLSHDIIVRMHKGELNVETAEGEFTEFTILLPKN